MPDKDRRVMGEEDKPLVSFLVRKNAPPGPAAPAAPVPAAALPQQTETQPLPSAASVPPPPTTGGLMSGKFKAPGNKSVFGVNSQQRMSAIRALPGQAPQLSQALGAVPRSRTGVYPKLPTQSVPALPQNLQASTAVPASAPKASPGVAEGGRARAEGLLQKGLDHFDRGEFEQALSAYRDSIASDPGFAMAYNNLGMVLIDLERYEDALEALYGSIRRDANYAEAYNNLGFVLRRLGQDAQAAAAYQRFLALEPDVEEGDKINAWIDTVRSEQGLGEIPEFELPASISDAPEPEVQPAEPVKVKKMAAWEATAGVQPAAAPLNALGEFVDSPQRAAPLPPAAALPAAFVPALNSPAAPAFPAAPGRADNAEEQANRQTALIEKSLDEFEAGNIDEARTLAEQALAIDAQSSEAHTALGKVLVREEKFGDGIRELEEAIALDPLDPAPFYVLGFTLRALERNVEAAEIYETFLKLMPDAIDALKMRQWILHIKGIAEADGTSDHEDDGFIDQEPIVTETDQLYKSALAHFRSANADEVADECEQILAEQPGHVRTRLLLGRAHLRRQDFDSAATAFAQALEVQPDSSEALYFMGQCEEKRGDSPRALKLYRSYMENHPDGPRVAKLRAWFLSHGVSDTGKGLSQQIQCEWCLRFFDENEISLHENKATCNGCLTLMGSTPIQDANKLEAYEPGDVKLRRRNSGGGFKKLALAGMLGSVVAVAALGYFTPLLDPVLFKLNLKKPPVIVSAAPKPNLPSYFGPNAGTGPGGTGSGDADPLTALLPNTPATVKSAADPRLDLHFDGTKVRIANEPPRESAVLTRWSWKPELAGVEALDELAQGWKTEFFLKGRPVGMSTVDGTIVWNATEAKDFEALKKGLKYTVELTIRGYWSGPDLARKDLFSVTKSFSVASQFGYELGQEVDVGLPNDARNIEFAGLGSDNGTQTIGVLFGSQEQGGARSVSFGADGIKRSLPLTDSGRCAAACGFALRKSGQNGVLVSNWKTGEVSLFLNKSGTFEPKATVKFVPGVMALAAFELDDGTLAVGALSSALGTLCIRTYDAEKGFQEALNVPLAGSGGSCRLLPWKSAKKGSGFLAVLPLAEDPLRFVAFNSTEKSRTLEAVRSVLKDEGVITAALALAAPQGKRLALVLGGRTSHVLLLEEKNGAFSAVGTKVVLPGPGLGAVAWDFNEDGCDDLFVTTRDEACFFFTGFNDQLTAGPVLNNPGMLGPAALVNLRGNARPEIAVLNENKKARLFKALAGDPAMTTSRPAAVSSSEPAAGENPPEQPQK